jgi:hypothetical protein
MHTPHLSPQCLGLYIIFHCTVLLIPNEESKGWKLAFQEKKYWMSSVSHVTKLLQKTEVLRQKTIIALRSWQISLTLQKLVPRNTKYWGRNSQERNYKWLAHRKALDLTAYHSSERHLSQRASEKRNPPRMHSCVHLETTTLWKQLAMHSKSLNSGHSFAPIKSIPGNVTQNPEKTLCKKTSTAPLLLLDSSKTPAWPTSANVNPNSIKYGWQSRYCQGRKTPHLSEWEPPKSQIDALMGSQVCSLSLTCFIKAMKFWSIRISS